MLLVAETVKLCIAGFDKIVTLSFAWLLIYE
jgi:hypothetical protein